MTDATDDLGSRRRRVLYRATHRGTKEMDRLVGSFVAARVADADDAELIAWEALLLRADPELYDCIMTGSGIGDAEHDDLIRRIRAFHGLT
jgi:antitoxin CptB